MRTALLIPCLVVLARAAAAADNLDLQIHGFASQGYLVTNHNDYLSRDSEGTGTFDLIEAGMNVMATPIDRLRVGIQVTATDLGEYGDMRPQIDWAYGSYQIPNLTSWLTLEATAGRIKVEYGFYNEYRDLDMTRSTVFLPLTVYDPRFREVFLAMNGAQLKAGIGAGPAGSFDLAGSIGNTTLDVQNSSIADFMRLNGAAPASMGADYVFTGRLTWNTPVNGLRARASLLGAENLVIDGALTAIPGSSFEYSIPHYRSGAVGVEWQFGDFTLVGEASETYYKQRNTYVIPTGPFTSMTIVDDEYNKTRGAYVSGAWRFHPALEAVIGYQWGLSDPIDADPVINPSLPPAEREHSRALSVALRWDVTEHWLIKGEAQWIDGTLLISDGEQRDNPRGAQESWALYAVKTTFDF